MGKEAKSTIVTHGTIRFKKNPRMLNMHTYKGTRNYLVSSESYIGC